MPGSLSLAWSHVMYTSTLAVTSRLISRSNTAVCQLVDAQNYNLALLLLCLQFDDLICSFSIFFILFVEWDLDKWIKQWQPMSPCSVSCAFKSASNCLIRCSCGKKKNHKAGLDCVKFCQQRFRCPFPLCVRHLLVLLCLFSLTMTIQTVILRHSNLLSTDQVRL